MTKSSSNNAAGLPLLGKNAIVTGAARGIGAAIAYKLASDGANVFLGYTSDSSAAKVAEVVKRIQALPHQPKAHAVKANLGQLDGPEKFVAQLKSLTAGEPKIDILVNNAGMSGMTPLHEITPKHYDDIFNVNVRGVLLLTVAIRPFIQPHGRIVNISSVAARTGMPAGSIYAASKAALEGLTRGWAAELGGNGTTVNGVSPGPVPSDMLNEHADEMRVYLDRIKAQTPVENRIATEEEIPNIVAWLASPAASWVTGHFINASGGFQMI